MAHSENARFADYRGDAADWITLATGEYYPDILPRACELYAPVLVLFGQLLRRSESSEALFMNLCEVREGWMRVQLSRVFRKYVSPSLSVEMLRRKRQAEVICGRFRDEFRKIVEVRKAFSSRPIPDEALCALLWEYKDRGKKGYDLTERFFAMARQLLPGWTVSGPERAGKDIRMESVWADYTKSDRPVDFVIRKGDDVLAVGFARYDGDRGGAPGGRPHRRLPRLGQRDSRLHRGAGAASRQGGVSQRRSRSASGIDVAGLCPLGNAG